MTESNSIDRKLPPHELNARRNRKRAVTHLPAIACLPASPETHRRHRSKHAENGNQGVYNPATNPVNNYKD